MIINEPISENTETTILAAVNADNSSSLKTITYSTPIIHYHPFKPINAQLSMSIINNSTTNQRTSTDKPCLVCVHLQRSISPLSLRHPSIHPSNLLCIHVYEANKNSVNSNISIAIRSFSTKPSTLILSCSMRCAVYVRLYYDMCSSMEWTLCDKTE
jgi:hypothetical protein